MTTDGTSVRWGDGRRADSDFAREQILDAAWRCYQQNTVQKTRMDHIAREAKVSRTTVYRYFQSRDEVLAGVVLRTLHELVDLIGKRVADTTSFAEYLVESLATAMELVPETPVYVALLKEATVVMSHAYIGSPEVFTVMCGQFRPHFEAAQAAGEVRAGIEFEQFMDWVIHVVAAYVMTPSPLAREVGIRSMLWRFLVPALVCDTAIPPERRS